MNKFKFGEVGQVVIFPNSFDDVCFSKRFVVTPNSLMDTLHKQGVTQVLSGKIEIKYFDYNVVTGTERYAIWIKNARTGNVEMIGYIDTEATK